MPKRDCTGGPSTYFHGNPGERCERGHRKLLVDIALRARTSSDPVDPADNANSEQCARTMGSGRSQSGVFLVVRVGLDEARITAAVAM